MKTVVDKECLLKEVLEKLGQESSKRTLHGWLKQKRVVIDGQLARFATQKVLPGQTVIVRPKSSSIAEGVKILYEDKELVVIDKPAALLSVATPFQKGNDAHTLLKKRFNHSGRIFPVHRLDRDASGVMVFAYTKLAQEKLKKAFEGHTIKRIYFAIVEGVLKVKKGTWKSYLLEDEETFFVKSFSSSLKGAKEAITHFEVIFQSKKYSLLRLTLETGRKNQIRVHCADAGYPILGDKKYGGSCPFSKRLFLHAHLLGFEHPTSKKEKRFSSPLPQEFYRIVPSASLGSFLFFQ